MARFPWFKFYPRDWLMDVELRLCSSGARGLWIDLICIMEGSPKCGYLVTQNGDPHDIKTIAKLTSNRTPDAKKWISELKRNGVISETAQGVMYCRKIVNREENTNKYREYGKRGGNPALTLSRDHGDKPRVKPTLKPRSQISDTDTPPPLTPPGGDEADSLRSSAFPETKNRSGKEASPDSPTIIVFPTDGPVREWHLTEAVVTEMQSAYETVQVLSECKRALAWIQANPDNRKTAKGMRRFLNSWINRAADRSAGNGRTAPLLPGQKRDVGQVTDDYIPPEGMAF